MEVVTETYDTLKEAEELADEETKMLVAELSRTIGLCDSALGKEFDVERVSADFPVAYHKLIRYAYSEGYKEGSDLVVNDD